MSKVFTAVDPEWGEKFNTVQTHCDCCGTWMRLGCNAKYPDGSPVVFEDGEYLCSPCGFKKFMPNKK